MKVRFGVELPDIGVDYKTIKEIALLCEELGYDTCLLCDHFYPPEHVGFNRPRVECWTTLSALAGDTERIRLGTFVLSNTFRHPPLLAKMSSTLDVISGGRLELGLGSGFHEPEHKAYGIRFSEPRVRVNRLREAVQIIKKMWTEQEISFDGVYYQVRDAFNCPKPVQDPHPPLLIAGGGERFSLKVVAEFADISNFLGVAGLTPEGFAEKFKILEKFCSEVNRDVDEIERSLSTDALVSSSERELDALVRKYKTQSSNKGVRDEKLEDYLETRLIGTQDECIEKIRNFVVEGVNYFVIAFPDILTRKKSSLRLFAEEVIPSFR